MSDGGKRLQQGRRQPRKKRSALSLVLIVAAVILAAGLLLWLLTRGASPSGPGDTAPSSTGPGDTAPSSSAPVQSADSAGQEAPQESAALSFPCTLEGGALTVSSLFQSTVFNPDCGGEMGEDIASLEFTNTSERYLERCEFTAVTADGAEYYFLAQDVPAGQTADAFETSNASLGSHVSWGSVTCTAVFSDAEPIPAGLQVSVEGIQITLTNNGAEDLTDYVVHCHCSLNGNYFGGMTYRYPIASLAAGETITVSAEACYLGEAAVARVAPAGAE